MKKILILLILFGCNDSNEEYSKGYLDGLKHCEDLIDNKLMNPKNILEKYHQDQFEKTYKMYQEAWRQDDLEFCNKKENKKHCELWNQ